MRRSVPGFEDFTLEIGKGSGRGRSYPIRISSPAGDLETTMRFPFTSQELALLLTRIELAIMMPGRKHRLALSNYEQAVRSFGQQLFEAVLPDEARGLFYQSRREADLARKGLRIKLRIDPPLLASLPWEFLYDPREATYLGLGTGTPIVRDVGLPQPIDPILVDGPLKILSLVANPDGLDELDVANERGRLEEALSSLTATGNVELRWLERATWRDLQRAIREDTFHVFHFVGHGGFNSAADEGLIALVDDKTGGPFRLRARNLAMLLEGARDLRLVVLNACEGAKGGSEDVFSSTASILVRRGVPAVLAMQYAISDEAAIEFSRVFYEAVAGGVPVDAAVSEARQGVCLAIDDSLEWATPVLYQRAPDGVLFDRGQPIVPGPVELWYLPARQAIADGRWDEAISLLERIRAADPTYRDVPALLGQAKRGQRVEQLLSAARIHQGAEAWSEVVETLSRIRSIDADFHDKDGLLASAEEGLRKQQLLAENSRQAAELYGQAQQALKAQDWSTAVDRLRALLATDAHYRDASTLLEETEQRLSAHMGANAENRSTRHLTGADEIIVGVPAPATRQLQAGRLLNGHIGIVTSLSYSPDGHSLASGSWDTTIRLWRADGATIRVLKVSTGWRVWTSLSNPIHAIAFSPDGRILAASTGDKTVQIWRVSDGALIRTLAGHGSAVWSVAFSPDGRMLASGSQDTTICLWRIQDGTLVKKLHGHNDTVWSLDFSPDGGTLASCAAEDWSVKLWRWDEEEYPRTLEGHNGWVRVVRFSPDGQTLASGSQDTTICIWRAHDDTPLQTLNGHRDTVWSLDYSSDGQMLASGGNDSAVAIWRPGHEDSPLSLARNASPVYAVAFNESGEYLASGGADKTIQIWRVEDEE